MKRTNKFYIVILETITGPKEFNVPGPTPDQAMMNAKAQDGHKVVSIRPKE